MIIGLVSDSHSMASRLHAAVGLLVQRGAAAVVHCGDVGSTDCIEALGAAGVPTYAVAGNTDRRIDQLAKAAVGGGVIFHRSQIEVPLGDGKHLVATHGDNANLLEELIASRQFLYVCHGHTHCAGDYCCGEIHVICPGAIRKPRQPRHPTAAVVNTNSGLVEYLIVPR